MLVQRMPTEHGSVQVRFFIFREACLIHGGVACKHGSGIFREQYEMSDGFGIIYWLGREINHYFFFRAVGLWGFWFLYTYACACVR